MAQPDDERSASSVGAAPDADATVRFYMTKDGMGIGISSYQAAKGKGRRLSLSLMEELLLKTGVKAEPDTDGMVDAFQAMSEGKDFQRILVAKGIPPIEPSDARLTSRGDLSLPVFSDQEFGSIAPAVHAERGMGVDGRVIEPKSEEEPSQIIVPKNGHVSTDKNTGNLVAETYGLVRVADGEVRVEPLMRLTEDRSRVDMDVYHQDFLGRPVTYERIQQELAHMGVSVPLEKEAIKAALAKAAGTKQPVLDVVVAQGTPPKHGEDSRLDWRITMREGGVGSKAAGGRVDFKERGVYPMAQSGMEIAVLLPATEGVPGRDVFGKVIEARQGRDITVKAGENVELGDGDVYIARGDGLVVYASGTLSVTDMLDIKSDIDYATGNIRLESGSVRIRGTVRSGFKVSAPKLVVVEEVVESARIYAGQGLEVRGGIIMQETGLIECGGPITAQYIRNAEVEAEGDVVANNAVSNCLITTKGKVVALKGKGKIQGGRIVCGLGVECLELGSEIGVATDVEVAAGEPPDPELLEEKKELVQQVKKIIDILGEDDPRAILLRTPPAKRKPVAELLKFRLRSEARIKEVKVAMAEAEKARHQALSRARIKVRKVAYQGVRITMAGRRLVLSEPVNASQFAWDPESRTIKIYKL